MGGHRQSGQYAGRLNFRPSSSSLTVLNPEIEEVTSGKAAEFSVLHHRPASRRLSRLLRPPGPQDAAHRFDRRARHALYALLRGDAGLHAQSRDLDDRADAVGARRAQQRLAAAAQLQHVRRCAARRRLRDRAGGQEPSAEFFRISGDAQAAAGARRRPGARCELRRGEEARRIGRPLRPGASQALGAGPRFRDDAAVLRLRARRSVHDPRRPGRRPLLRLAQVATAATPMRCATARTSCRTTMSVRRPIARRSRRSFIRPPTSPTKAASGSTATPRATAASRSS